MFVERQHHNRQTLGVDYSCNKAVFKKPVLSITPAESATKVPLSDIGSNRKNRRAKRYAHEGRKNHRRRRNRCKYWSRGDNTVEVVLDKTAAGAVAGAPT